MVIPRYGVMNQLQRKRSRLSRKASRRRRPRKTKASEKNQAHAEALRVHTQELRVKIPQEQKEKEIQNYFVACRDAYGCAWRREYASFHPILSLYLPDNIIKLVATYGLIDAEDNWYCQLTYSGGMFSWYEYFDYIR